jgi:hypothetical protein
MKQQGANPVRLSAQRSTSYSKGLASLGGGFRSHEISQTLYLGQVELAVLKRSQGEFTGLRRPEPGNLRESRDYPRENSVASGKVQLCHLFAGKTTRPAKS